VGAAALGRVGGGHGVVEIDVGGGHGMRASVGNRVRVSVVRLSEIEWNGEWNAPDCSGQREGGSNGRLFLGRAGLLFVRPRRDGSTCAFCLNR
jgi:hypothetical protein